VLGFGVLADRDAVTEPIDRALLAELASVVDKATAHFDQYDYTSALEVTEQYFWQFCDDYLELVKERAYGDGPGAQSARAALSLALSAVLRMLAPILPFATEEVWSWWQDGSIHVAAWPTTDEVAVEGDPRLLTDVAAALIELRGAKSKAKVSMKTEVSRVSISAAPDALERLRAVESDLRAVGRITGDIDWVSGDGPISLEVTLATTAA
jgi:valyl-tRNA synthetase